MVDIHRLTTANSFVADIGSCIYCRNFNQTGLSREHVVPLSLGGGIILHRASCKFHETMTRHFESEWAGETLGNFRNVRGLPTRDKKKRPKFLPVEITEDGVTRVEMVPVQHYPDLMPAVAIKQLPGLISGRASGAPLDAEIRIYQNKEALRKRASLYTTQDLSVSGRIHVASYLRLLAKIAHGMTVVEMGFNFEPLLLDIIEGNISDAAFLMGASHKEFDESLKPNTHLLAHEIIETPDGISYVLASVGLFHGLGAPVHTVVSGRFNTANPPPRPAWFKK